MISSKNIREYINFLHMKKYSAPATEDLKSRWAALRDDEIAGQLQGLYLHWGIDSRTAQSYEAAFLQFQQSVTMPEAGNFASQQVPAYPVQPAKAGGSNKTIVYLSVIIALLGICGFMFYKMSERSAVSPLTDTVSTAQPDRQRADIPQSAAPPAKVKDTATAATASPGKRDPQKVKVIETLLKAEEARDMPGILGCFSANLQQYWDVKNPSQSELMNRYNNTWTKTSDNANHDVRIERISDNVYDMYSVYEYYINKDGQAKSVNTHVRYIFDDNNKIIRTFGVN